MIWIMLPLLAFVFFGLYALATGHAERSDAGILEFEALHFLEEGDHG